MKSDSKLRFVVLLHEMPASSDRSTHWDLMLEEKDSLATWALESEPTSSELASGIRCRQLDQHRKHYLDYEGPVSQDRGHVKQWDSGSYRWIRRTATAQVISIAGAKLSGDFELLQQTDGWILQTATDYQISNT